MFFLFAALLFFICSVPFFICSVPLFYLQRSFFYICSGSLFCLQHFFFVCSDSFLFAAFLFCLQRFSFVCSVSFLFAACPLWATVLVGHRRYIMFKSLQFRPKSGTASMVYSNRKTKQPLTIYGVTSFCLISPGVSVFQAFRS